MAQRDVFRRYLEAGMAFTELTRARAEAIVKDLVKSGEIPRKRAEDYIDDMVERSRQNTEAIVTLVQHQIREQLGQLGIATKDDIAKLEARIESLSGRGGAGPAEASAKKLVVPSAPVGSAPKKAAAKKAGAKKASSATKA